MIELSLLPVPTLRSIESALRAQIKAAHDSGKDAPKHREALGKVGDEIEARAHGIARCFT